MIEKVFDEIETGKENEVPPENNTLSEKDALLLKRDKDDNQLQSAVSVIKGIRTYKNFSSIQGAAAGVSPQESSQPQPETK